MKTVDIVKMIDERPLGRFQWLMVFLGFLVVALDGFDAVIIGFIAPELTRAWGVNNASLGPVISSAYFGLAIGALVAGPLADRFGRKPVVVVSVAFFGMVTLISAAAPSIGWLVLLRLLTGIGLGAAMPNASTLVSEYSPGRHRSVLTTIVISGFMCGASIGGFLAAFLIPHLGWRSVLVAGGLLPLLVLPLLLWKLPESVRLLVVREAAMSRIHRIVRRLAPEVADIEQTRYVGPQPAAVARGQGRHPVATILSTQFRTGTLLVWLTYAMGLFLTYLLGGWLPTLVKGIGFDVSDAAVISALFQFGGMLGAISVGWIMDRTNPHYTLALAYLIGGLAIIGLALTSHGFAIISLLAIVAGFCLNGGNSSMYALAANYYPTAVRATGVSWMRGIGGLGSIGSGFAGAMMLGAGWSFSTVFSALAVPAAIAAFAVLAKGVLIKPLRTASPPAAQPAPASSSAP